MQARLQTTQEDGNQSRYVPSIRDRKKENWLIRVKRIHFNPCWGWFNSSQMLVEIIVGLEPTDLWRIINNNKYETYPANIQ